MNLLKYAHKFKNKFEQINYLIENRGKHTR